jgi:uncharacterized membrane protein
MEWRKDEGRVRKLGMIGSFTMLIPLFFWVSVVVEPFIYPPQPVPPSESARVEREIRSYLRAHGVSETITKTDIIVGDFLTIFGVVGLYLLGFCLFLPTTPLHNAINDIAKVTGKEEIKIYFLMGCVFLGVFLVLIFVAIESLEEPDGSQMWTRIMVLWPLAQIGFILLGKTFKIAGANLHYPTFERVGDSYFWGGILSIIGIGIFGIIDGFIHQLKGFWHIQEVLSKRVVMKENKLEGGV